MMQIALRTIAPGSDDVYDGIPQDKALRLQLVAIRGNADRGFYEIRRKTHCGMRQFFTTIEDIEATAELILKFSGETDVYVGAAPRTRRAGGVDAIAWVWTLWADVDGTEALARLRAFSPQPALVVHTGTGQNCHAWWPLREPLTPADARHANRRLAHHLDADLASTDAARILRPAGTLNFKHDPPAPVMCGYVRVDARAPTAEDVLSSVPPLPEPPTPPTPARSMRPAADDALRAVPATVYIPALTGRAVGLNGKVRCPFHARGEERTPSLHAYPDPDQGWFCWGCSRGGTIVDFGASLYEIEPRGRGYHDIRRRLAQDLLTHIRHAAA
jgi:hypothetical protein